MPEEQYDSGDDIDVPAEFCKELPIDFKVLHPDKLQYLDGWQMKDFQNRKRLH